MTDDEDIEEVVDDVNELSGILTRMQAPGAVSRAGGWLRVLLKLLVPIGLAGGVVWAHRTGRLLQSLGRTELFAGLAVVLLVVYLVLFRSGEDDSWTAGPGERFEV